MKRSNSASNFIVRLKNIDKTYQLGKVTIRALKNFNLNIKRGEFLVVLGPSGSGKTTLLNIIGGIDIPTSGSVYFEDLKIDNLDEAQLTEYRRREIGFIFQFFNLISTLTAGENVDFALELSRKDRPSKKSSTELLEMVSLKDRAHNFPFQLSGGERQRVSIARALAKDPPLMLCDEPTGELDFKTGKKILKIMRLLNQKEGKTFILVTHNSVISEIADRVIFLHDGEIAREKINQNPKDPETLEW